MIYIVEDDSSIRELEQYALASNGYETKGLRGCGQLLGRAAE